MEAVWFASDTLRPEDHTGHAVGTAGNLGVLATCPFPMHSTACSQGPALMLFLLLLQWN